MINIAIFSETSQAESLTGKLLEQLKSLPPSDYQWFDLNLTGQNRVTINPQALTWNGVDLCRLKIAFIHGFNYQNPVIPEAVDNKDWSLWNADSIIRQQKYSLLFSLFSELQRRGVILINPLKTIIGNYMKVNCLNRINGTAIKAAKFLCSNEKTSVDEFMQAHPQSVWRPSTGRAAWQLFSDKQSQDLIALHKPPILIAVIEPGPLRRAYCLNGQVILLLNQAAPSEQAQLERLEMYQSIDYSAYQTRLSNLCKQMDMPWVEVLFVDNGDELIIYEMEPDPPIEHLPISFSDYLCSVLSNYMRSIADLKPFTTTPYEQIIAQRSALFTRRMLRILFDFERSKYHD